LILYRRKLDTPVLDCCCFRRKFLSCSGDGWVELCWTRRRISQQDGWQSWCARQIYHMWFVSV